MAFPTTSILDNFNRADESPATGWPGVVDGNYSQSLKVVSNQGACIDATDAYPYWGTSYAADQEGWITVIGSGFCSLYARLNPIANASVDGYEVEVDIAGDAVNIKRVDGAVSTLLGASISQAFASGDAIGIECIGNDVSAYYKPAAGAWSSSLGTRTDATYNQAGYPGLYLSQNTMIVDDFGGGEVVVAAGATHGPLLLLGVG